MNPPVLPASLNCFSNVSTAPAFRGSYAYFSGTSMAVAPMAGITITGGRLNVNNALLSCAAPTAAGAASHAFALEAGEADQD